MSEVLSGGTSSDDVGAQHSLEKREVTGSTPVPTTAKYLLSGHKSRSPKCGLHFRAHNVPTRNWNRF